MKRLIEYMNEKLIINKNYKRTYTCAPESWYELREIIEDRYDKLGPGTEQNPIDFNDVDISNIDSFYNRNNEKGVFEKTEFEYIDISNWDVSKVENMNGLFFNCRNLKSVGDLSQWNVSNVKKMSSLFRLCAQLKSVGDLSRWNVSNVEDISGMFRGCKELKSVGDLSKWDISCVEYIYGMFENSGIINIPDWYEE